MGSQTLVALLLFPLVASCYAQFNPGFNLNIPRSSSGRPFGIDLSRNTELYPDYNSRFGTVGFGLEHRPSPNLNINVRPGVHYRDILSGRFRPQGQVGLQYRPNSNTRFNIGAGVDANGKPRGNVGLSFRWRRRRSAQNETESDDDINIKLFKVLDMNEDGQLDVSEWFVEGGKVPSFAALIQDHDQDLDEMISLEEFLSIPVEPDLDIDISHLRTHDQRQEESQEEEATTESEEGQ